jgi:hypothetical protein
LTSSDSDQLITGSVYTDINGEHQDPTVQVINTLRDIVSSDSAQLEDAVQPVNHVTNDSNLPTISYGVRGQPVLMNHWDDAHYFTSAFPTLFPNGIGGHKDQRPIVVSLEAFAEWALSHHSRR